MQSDKVSLKDKAIIIGALGYLILSYRYCPDVNTNSWFGWRPRRSSLCLGKVWSQVDDNLKDKAKQKLSKWFDEDELNFSEDPFAEDDTNVPV